MAKVVVEHGSIFYYIKEHTAWITAKIVVEHGGIF